MPVKVTRRALVHSSRDENTLVYVFKTSTNGSRSLSRLAFFQPNRPCLTLQWQKITTAAGQGPAAYKNSQKRQNPGPVVFKKRRWSSVETANAAVDLRMGGPCVRFTWSARSIASTKDWLFLTNVNEIATTPRPVATNALEPTNRYIIIIQGIGKL